MKASEHMAIIQEQLKLLNAEGHVKTEGQEDPACWNYWMESIHAVNRLEQSMNERDLMKGNQDEWNQTTS